MKRSLPGGPVRYLALSLLALAAALSLALAQEKVIAPPGTAVNITVVPSTASPPPASITLFERRATSRLSRANAPIPAAA